MRVIWLPVCPHCKRFMPTVPAMQKKYGKKGLKIMTVTHGKKDWTAKFLRDKKWNFPVGFDWTGVTAKRYGMKGMPGVLMRPQAIWILLPSSAGMSLNVCEA